jgi:methyltransferase (TIGR00027 family)
MTDSPSQTALLAAAGRAAHPIVDHEPFIFVDPCAEALLGEQAGFIDYHRQNGDHTILVGVRTQATIRARLTEERLLSSGAGQYIILGAGLDSYAYREKTGIHVYEVDRPASQADKRRRVEAAGLAAVTSLTYVAVDLESSQLLPALTSRGFDVTRPAVVSWLGVSMYLTPSAFRRTLGELGQLAAGSHLVLDYLLPAGQRDEAGRVYVDSVAAATAERGEPWLAYYSPSQMRDELARCGFIGIASVDQRDALPAALWQRTDALRPAGLAMIASATVGACAGTRLALTNARLFAVARWRLAELRAGQRRVVAAADAERRRIEREICTTARSNGW